MPGPLIDDRLRAELSRRYGAADRHYHDLGHVEAMLALARQEDLSDRAAVEAAIWFHDAIYDSRAADNEARSAALARARLSGTVDDGRLQRIVAMIEATAGHTLPELGDDTWRGDAELFLDMDLAILGAPPAVFDRYEVAIRREYQWVPEAAWRTGRAAVLETFLNRPRIYRTASFGDRFEAQARLNITRSIAALRG